MTIKASTSAEVRALVDALISDDELRREGAIARLAVIGGRATDRLLTAYAAAVDARVRVAILRALEGIGDTRALTVACEALHDGGDAGVAAAAVLKPFLDSRDPAVAAASLDALIEAALDAAKERRVRVAACAALRDIPPAMLAKVTGALAADVPAAAAPDAPSEALLKDAADGRLPDDPAALRAAVLAYGAAASLTALQNVVDAVGARERSTKSRRDRDAWQQVRGAAHHALALRGSRLALYDLRESVERADRSLPPSFLSSMRAIGDSSCVEALAAALARAPEDDLWWRHQLASALRGIARRERITKRHASMKRALARWPRAADALL